MAAAIVDLTSAESQALDGFRIMLYSASSPRAADIGRGQIEAHYHKMLTAALRGKHAPQRAALLLAFVAGIQVMRQIGRSFGPGRVSAQGVGRGVGPPVSATLDRREPGTTPSRPLSPQR